MAQWGTSFRESLWVAASGDTRVSIWKNVMFDNWQLFDCKTASGVEILGKKTFENYKKVRLFTTEKFIV